MIDQLIELDSERDELLRQARIARTIGSPFVAAVLEAVARHLSRAPHTAGLLAHWPGDRAAAALAMRLNAALHALARRDTPARLGALYRGEHEDVDGAVAEALAEHDDFIAAWMRHTPQTNEVGRSAAIMAALHIAQTRFDRPVEVLEIGSSAGLNLNLHRYRHDLGGMILGNPNSPVLVAPEWRGTPPPAAECDIAAACGVDLSPLDVTDPATRERLMAYVFADQPARSQRLERALDLARRHPPDVVRGDAIDWLRERLDAAERPPRCRVVVHSMVIQYLDATARAQLDSLVAAAGAAATMERPLARIAFEWTGDRAEVQLRLTCYPPGETLILATCHPYGAWVNWRGE